MFALEPDVTARRQIGERLAQPGRDLAAVGIGLGRCPERHIQIRNSFAVQDDRDFWADTGDRIPVPFAGLFNDAFCRGQVTEYRSAVPSRRRLGPFLGEVVGNLDFYRIRNPVVDVRTVDDDAAVRSFGGHELEVESEVIVVFDRPDGLVFRGGENPLLDRPDSLRKYGIGEIRFEERRP